MSNNPLQNLKMLFPNCPEVLRMLDARELDLSGLESEAYIREQKKRKLYPEPVNFYVTGRTGAGKTSLGNTFLDTGKGKPPMESHGHQDCTSSVQFFQLASNLRYFDLPGAGSNEQFENINRASLVIEQITDEDEEISPVNQLKVLDFSEYETKGVQEEIVGVDKWQSSDNQKFVAADIILYVVAPHMLFIGDDKRYLRALLKSQTQRHQNQKIIFALNIHRTKDGQLKPTPQNLADARKIITEIYQKFYPNTIPPIVEIDSLTGTGISQITEFICQILPSEKVGNMQQVLKDEFKEVAKKERSYRYRQTLIYIASRLATYTVDTPLGQGLLKESYAAVSNYGIKVFKQEDIIAQAEQEIYGMVDNLAAEAKAAREESLKRKEAVTEIRDIKQTVVIQKPIYKSEKVTDTVTDYHEATESRLVERYVDRESKIGRFFQPLIGRKKKQFLENETVMKPLKREVERWEERFAGMEEERDEVVVGSYEAVVGQRDVDTGVKKSKQGGYVVIEDLLAIGLGLELADPSQDLRKCFDKVIQKGRQQVQATLSRYRDKINQLAESNDPDVAEAQIIKILESSLLK